MVQLQKMTFQDVPKQNYGDVFVCNNGGFTGELSDLRYFDYGLGVFEIMNIVNRGQILHQVMQVKQHHTITYQIHGICNFEVFLLIYYILYYSDVMIIIQMI